MNNLDDAIGDAVDRLDDAFNQSPTATQFFSTSSLRLERPGLALFSSRSPAVRRPILASMIEDIIFNKGIEGADSARKKVVVFANATQGILMSEVISAASSIEFTAFDDGSIKDEQWPLITDAVNGLVDCTDLHWINGPVSVSEIIKNIEECERNTSLFIESAHLINGLNDVSFGLAELRNCAAVNEVFIYLGVGLSHWPDVRKTDPVLLVLTDLPEGYAQVIDIADKIVMFAITDQGISATNYDPRFVLPWRGLWEPREKQA